MTAGASRNPHRRPCSCQRVAGVGARRGRSKKGAQSLARRTSTPARGALLVAARQSRPVDGGRKSRSQMDEKGGEREGEGGRDTDHPVDEEENEGRTGATRERRREEERRGSAIQKKAVRHSVVRCFRGTDGTESGTSGLRRHRVAGGGRARAEPGALFRAQYARRARPVRCRVRVVEVLTSAPSPAQGQVKLEGKLGRPNCGN